MARYFHKKVPVGEDAFSLNQHVLLRRLLHEGVRLVANPVVDQEATDADLQDMVKDIAVALLGRDIEFGEEVASQCPNGIRIGTPSLIKEDRMYENLPPLLKYEDWE